jgi:DNA-binding IclR family transcriptional regulator
LEGGLTTPQTKKTDNADTNSKTPPNDGSSVRALVRGLSILRCFDTKHQTWSFIEIREQLGLSNATTYRLVKTLEAEGFLAMDAKTGRYYMGPSSLQTAYLALSSDQLARIALPHMEHLAEQTGETVDLSVWTDQGPLYVQICLTSRPYKPVHQIGEVWTDMCNCSTKVFLAFGPAGRRKAVLARPISPTTEYSITNPDEITRELEKVRHEGIAYDFQEHEMGICAVSAPVYDSTSELRAAMTVVCPVERFGPVTMKRLAEALRAAAPELSKALGYREN